MNKKFSTLMASLLLASAFSVGNAATSYVKFTENGTNATAIKQGAAYQLKSEDNQVLALVRTGAAYNYSYTLKLVSKDDATNLAETLWKVSYQENKEGGPSFTFVSAAYGIPLSFTPNKDGVNETFPGTESLWKWLPSVKEINDGNVVKNYYKSQVDSVLVLDADNDGKVYANRQKASVAAGLNLRPVEAASVILGADDLNSMMMTQIGAEKFKLTFNPNVQNGKANVWTENQLTAKALPTGYTLPKVLVTPAEGATLYTEAEAQAADEAKAAAAAFNADMVVSIVNGLTVADAVKNAVANDETVTDAENFNAAVTAANAAVQTLIDAQTLLTAQYGVYTNILNVFTPAITETPAATADDIRGLMVLDDATEAYHDNGKNTALIDLIKKAVTDNAAYSSEQAKQDIINGIAAFIDALPESGTASGGDADQQKRDMKALVANDANYKTEWDALVDVVVGSAAYINNSEAARATLAERCAAVKTNALVLKNKVGNDETLTVYESVISKAKKGVTAITATVEGTEIVKTEALEAIDDLASLTGTFTSDQVKEAVKAALEDYATAGQDYAADKTTVSNALAAVEADDVIEASADAITDVLGTAGEAQVQDALEAALEDLADDATVSQAVAAIAAWELNAGDAVPGTGTEAQYGEANNNEYLRISLNKQDSKKRDLYLAVDTNFVTGAAGRRHLGFGSWYYDAAIKNCEGDQDLSVANNKLFRDYNGRFAFKFTYFPTQDSLDIQAAGYAMTPKEGTHCWKEITNVEAARNDEGNGSTVKLAVLASNHTEATVGKDEWISGAGHSTINTRIGFNASVAQATKIDAGVYTIQFVTNVAKNSNINGRYVVNNWLKENEQYLVKVEDQDLNHMPAAQWVLTHENGSTVNTILNRESGKQLAYASQSTSSLPISLLYATATEGMYTTIYGDSLKLAKVDATALKDSTLGYFAAAPYNKETGDQLNVYRLKYLSNLADVFVSFNAADSILNVSAIEAAEAPKFRLIPAADAYQYGVSNKDLAKDLYRQAYYIQYETGKANLKEADKLYVIEDRDGKYRLTTSKLDEKGNPTYVDTETGWGIQPFFLKEFKEANGAHSYALVETVYNDDLENYVVANGKVSVKDYPSTLVSETLEGELNETKFWSDDNGYVGLNSYNGRTSTFLLAEIEAPMYRRLGVTDENDGLINEGTNNVKIYSTRNTNRYLYENTANKVAGYEKDPLGLNFLGDINVKEATKNLSIFVDTAYVRNNTARPQYMLALRPDFTPDTIPCEAHPASHPYDLVDAVHADYLVTLTDSVAAYTKKTTKDKFLFDGYTRLAFVPAKHIGDKLIIKESVFTGDNAKKNEIDLSKNAFVEGAWQFRLTGNEGAEFYIEGANSGSFIRLINGVAVLTKDIADAERFNIEKTDENATANEAIEASEVVVISGKGAITVQGAAGKVITVADILGRTIANQVAASDNVTIAAPAGIAVVTVDGEATKVVVK